MNGEDDRLELDEYWLRKAYPLSSFLLALGIAPVLRYAAQDTALAEPFRMSVLECLFGAAFSLGVVFWWWTGWRRLPLEYHRAALWLNVLGLGLSATAAVSVSEVNSAHALILGGTCVGCALYTGFRILTGRYPEAHPGTERLE